jgi:hypothetical protein
MAPECTPGPFSSTPVPATGGRKKFIKTPLETGFRVKPPRAVFTLKGRIVWMPIPHPESASFFVSDPMQYQCLLFVSDNHVHVICRDGGSSSSPITSATKDLGRSLSAGRSSICKDAIASA